MPAASAVAAVVAIAAKECENPKVLLVFWNIWKVVGSAVLSAVTRPWKMVRLRQAVRFDFTK